MRCQQTYNRRASTRRRSCKNVLQKIEELRLKFIIKLKKQQRTLKTDFDFNVQSFWKLFCFSISCQAAIFLIGSYNGFPSLFLSKCIFCNYLQCFIGNKLIGVLFYFVDFLGSSKRCQITFISPITSVIMRRLQLSIQTG